jgi:hypothetical protein
MRVRLTLGLIGAELIARTTSAGSDLNQIAFTICGAVQVILVVAHFAFEDKNKPVSLD